MRLMKPRRRAMASNRGTPKRRKTKPNPRSKPKRANIANAPKGVKPARKAKVAKPVSRLGPKTVAALEREVRRLRLARGRLERRLTATVQEIGMLRQFETHARSLEAELARRDAEIERLRQERDERLREAEIRGPAPIASTPP
jgi:hypothetical protein